MIILDEMLPSPMELSSFLSLFVVLKSFFFILNCLLILRESLSICNVYIKTNWFNSVSQVIPQLYWWEQWIHQPKLFFFFYSNQLCQMINSVEFLFSIGHYTLSLLTTNRVKKKFFSHTKFSIFFVSFKFFRDSLCKLFL